MLVQYNIDKSNTHVVLDYFLASFFIAKITKINIVNPKNTHNTSQPPELNALEVSLILYFIFIVVKKTINTQNSITKEFI